MGDRNALKVCNIAGSFSGSSKDWATSKAAVYIAAQSNIVTLLLTYSVCTFKGRQLTGTAALNNSKEWKKHFDNTTNFDMSHASLTIQVVKATITEHADAYKAMTEDAQKSLQTYNVNGHVKRANQLLLTARREYFLIKKNNQLLDQLQAILDYAIIIEVCV